LKEEESDFVNPAVLINNQNQPADLFTNAGGGWYFSNTAQKSKGFSEFKAKWGNRPNLDNWRRKSAVDAALVQNNTAPAAGTGTTDPALIPEEDLSVDGLKKNLPLTEEQKLESNKKIAGALFQQGQLYKNQLEDYARAALVFEELWTRFNNYAQEEETLFELYYCNNKAGNKEKSDYFLNLLNQKYPKGEFVQRIHDAKNPKPAGTDTRNAAYENIYNLFIEGKFDDALQQKKIADSVYGKTYWTSQLLYVESLYHIKQKDDSTAIVTLTNIQSGFPGTPMAEKAEVMIDVLKRRKEIEDYLTNTNIVRESDSVYIPFDDGPQVNKITQEVIKKDSSRINVTNQPAQGAGLQQPVAPVQKTTAEKKDRNSAGQITIGNKPATDTTRLKPLKEAKIETAYIYTPNEPYVVLMYFDAVDPIYISESKIAFNRYNNASHSGEGITITIYEGGGDNNWLELGSFTDVSGILSYMDELKLNAKQIVPWLPADKYNFLVISLRNLEILKTRKSLEEYKLFIGQHIKDKF
jgi:outer membrane protein assembly factor BamD (BamD/ComL family)